MQLHVPVDRTFNAIEMDTLVRTVPAGYMT
jgi:hypothetical protein